MLAIIHASHLIAAPSPVWREVIVGGTVLGSWQLLPASHSLGSALLTQSAQEGDEEDSRVEW